MSIIHPAVYAGFFSENPCSQLMKYSQSRQLFLVRYNGEAYLYLRQRLLVSDTT